MSLPKPAINVSLLTKIKICKNVNIYVKKAASTYALKNEDLTKLTPRETEMRTRFWQQEKQWESQINWEKLRNNEKEIIRSHNAAINNGHFTYDDPETGRRVMTRLRHFLRESCCGSACRHCIYDHDNVPADQKGKKVFNSAFWVDAKPQEDDERENSDDEDNKPYFV